MTSTINTFGTLCNYRTGDDFIAATDYLNNIAETEWERVIGTQSREEFATLTIEQGQAIEDAWNEALAHADSL